MIYIRTSKPLTVQRLVGVMKQVYGGEQAEEAGKNVIVHVTQRVLSMARPYLDALDSEWVLAETKALHELNCLMSRVDVVGMVVAPLVVPAALPDEMLPLLEGFTVKAWSEVADADDVGLEHVLSPLALLWVKEVGAVSESPTYPRPTGQVTKVVTGDGMTVMQVSTGQEGLTNGAISVCYEQRQHGEEHVDEGMYLLQVNLDDVSAEWVAYTMETLFRAGANDVTILPMTMKKSRAGMMLQVMCYQSQVEAMKTIMFQETSTFGIRYFPVACHRLARRFERVQTEWGEVPVKIGYHRGERVQVAPEYDVCARLARENSVPLKKVYQAAVVLGQAVSGRNP